MKRTIKLAWGSIAVGVAVLGLKFLAYRLTGSVALYSDAVESVINVAAACAALVAIRLSAKPADRNHPYGHHKAEYFSAVLEGALIVLAAIEIFREAYADYKAPHAIAAPFEGLLVNGLASAVNAVWCVALLRIGRRERSPALLADGKHLLTDVVSSVGVALGVTVAAITGWHVLDPALAALVAVNIVWSGWGLVRESVGGLMDEAPNPEEVEMIKAVIATHGDGAIEAHDLRTRHAGRATFVDFHLVVPGQMVVAEAHAICDRIERAIQDKFEDAIITIHIEPEDMAKHSGIVVV